MAFVASIFTSDLSWNSQYLNRLASWSYSPSQTSTGTTGGQQSQRGTADTGQCVRLTSPQVMG